MLFIIKVVMLVSMIKILLITERPGVCAAVYTGIGLFFGLMFGFGLLYLMIAGAMAFGLSFAYFWLLNRLQGGGLFWLIAILGVVIGVV